MNHEKKVSITILLPAGRLPLDIMECAHQLASRYSFGIYLSLLQNLRLVDVPENAVENVKQQLAILGAEFKQPGRFPIPRICVGKDHCNLGLVDTEDLSKKILNKFSSRELTKAKLKIAIAGCTLCCSGSKNSDIGIIATRNGYDIFVGGKGGPFPKIGMQIAKGADEHLVLETVSELINFHDLKTEKKQRLFKLLGDPGFPFKSI